MWDPGWDKVFEKNEWGKYPGEDLIRFIARRFYKVPDRSAVEILELGCGTGANLWYLAREGFSATGIDGSKIALERAARRLKEEGLDAILKQGDVADLPFDAQSFDCVIDIECIYANSLPDTGNILKEAQRVLKPGGWLFSRTFATGMDGEDTAIRVEGEPHTYSSMPGGPLHSDYGLIRLTDESEIATLYGIFSEINYDITVRSDWNRQVEIKEWLICCRK